MLLLTAQTNISILEKYSTDVNTMITSFAPFAKSVLPDDKPGMRSMAEGRAGLVMLTSSIATQNPNSLSRKDDPRELEMRIGYEKVYLRLRQSLVQMLQYVDDTRFLNSVDIMTLNDRYTKSLNADRDNNAAVNEAMKEVDEWNKRYGSTAGEDAPTTPETPATPTNS